MPTYWNKDSKGGLSLLRPTFQGLMRLRDFEPWSNELTIKSETADVLSFPLLVQKMTKLHKKTSLSNYYIYFESVLEACLEKKGQMKKKAECCEIQQAIEWFRKLIKHTQTKM